MKPNIKKTKYYDPDLTSAQNRRKIEQDFLKDLATYKATGQYPGGWQLPQEKWSPPRSPFREPRFWLGVAAISLMSALLPFTALPIATAVALMWGIWWGTRG